MDSRRDVKKYVNFFQTNRVYRVLKTIIMTFRGYMEFTSAGTLG